MLIKIETVEGSRREEVVTHTYLKKNCSADVSINQQTKQTFTKRKSLREQQKLIRRQFFC